jgi:hypothetical protein
VDDVLDTMVGRLGAANGILVLLVDGRHRAEDGRM